MTSSEALAYLLALPRFAEQGAAAYRPGLDAMRALLAALGDPHERFASVHVGGTNGKGSTASMIAAIGMASGRRVGLHTSPHLVRVGERMRVGGAPASETWLADVVARCRPAFDVVGLSFFEATVALSFLYFAEQSADVSVVEVGLGGRLDATNVLAPRVALVTNVALDHTDLLGATLAEIAREKAGIAKPGVPFLHAADPAARAALHETAEAAGAPVEDVRATCAATLESQDADGVEIALRTPVRDYGRLRVGLAGAHGVWNAALAVRAAETAFEHVSESAVRDGLARVRALSGLRGRCETVAPGVVADVAHNPDGWAAALACARPALPGRLFVLAGIMRDKDAEAFARLLAASGAAVLPVELPSARALGGAEWRDLLGAWGVQTFPARDVSDGLHWFRTHAAPADRLLVTGSHLAVEALLRALGPADSDSSSDL